MASYLVFLEPSINETSFYICTVALEATCTTKVVAQTVSIKSLACPKGLRAGIYSAVQRLTRLGLAGCWPVLPAKVSLKAGRLLATPCISQANSVHPLLSLLGCLR